jgi:hypothetical protein
MPAGAFSQAFYLDERWRRLGHSSLEDFLVDFWEGFFLDDRDANKLLTMLWTWEHGDIGRTPGFGGLIRAGARGDRSAGDRPGPLRRRRGDPHRHGLRDLLAA